MNLNTCFFSGSSTWVNCHHRSLQGWSCPWEEKVCVWLPGGSCSHFLT